MRSKETKKILLIIFPVLLLASLLTLGFIYKTNNVTLEATEYLPRLAGKIFLPLNAVLTVDNKIGDVQVEYWEHIIDGKIKIQNDFILIHRDTETGYIVKYEKSWRDIELPDIKFEPFTPPGGDYSWKRAVAFLNKTDPGHFYTFYGTPKYPLICWEVRYADGTTGLYDLDGDRIGHGIPVP